VTVMRPNRRGRGFTLLEILVAVTILGIALVSLLGLHARNIRLTAETQELTMATMLASRIVATTRAGAIPPEGTVEGTFSANEQASVNFDEIYGGEGSEDYVWVRDVRRAPNPPAPPGLFLIRVSVSPRDATHGAELNFAMDNGVAENAYRALRTHQNGTGE
jgi:prepilin-type N-terminal cleavage/methylation domain-containing protein